MAEGESLVARRPKRSTAGNRMELALAELAPEEPQEADDIDFVVDKEEDDVFESDFASTDEEAAREDVDEGDKAVRDEERRERRTVRSRVEKATASAHARQRVTFNPEATPSQQRSKPTQKTKRRVSLGIAVNAETGEVIEGSVGAKRQSQRRHTVMNTSATVNRMKDAEEKRAAIPKKTKIITKLPTQDELIARALDTEEGNITEHRDYLRLEEEKRAKARVVKQAIEGPVLRWISKKETVKVDVQPPLTTTTTTTSAQLYAAKYSFVYTSGVGAGTVGGQAYSMPFYPYTPHVAQNAVPRSQEASSSGNPGESSVSPSGPSAAPTPPVQATPLLSSTSSSNVQDLASAGGFPSVISAQPQPPSVLFSHPTVSTPLVAHRTEDVCKNYVIHELSQTVPSKPPWKDTMSAMFGDHVMWDEVKVFTGKGRPLARPVRTCPITGLPAKYRDPRTNVPFAGVGAYEVLTRVLGREYVWCSALGCYVRVSETRSGSAEARGGSGGGDGHGEELEERTSKRRKVGLAGG